MEAQSSTKDKNKNGNPEDQPKPNKLIIRFTNSTTIQLEQIKTQKDLMKALKVNKNAQLFLTPNGTVPNIWVNTQTPQQKKAIVSQQQQRVENGN